MRITSFCAILALLFITQATAQVKIGDHPQSIDGASILELESNSRVFVVTRVNTAQMNAITPLRGALLYNTDEGCVFYYNGASWVNLCSEQNTTNVSLSLVDDDLVLTDSDGNSVSVTLEGVGVQTFTSDPVVNGQATIVITQTGDNFNFEVNQITGDNIVDGSINGFLDIQFNSISADQLAPNSVGQEELQDNTVGDLEIDYGQVTVSDFSNDAGYLTAANLVSTDVPNSLTTGTDGGVLYDDSALQTSINDHIANDGDLDDQNELITSAVLDGSNNLVINQPGGNITVPLNSLNNAGSDDQQLSLAGNILTLEDGGTVDLSGFAGTGTDDQQLSLAGNILTLEDGGTVDLSGFAGTGTDDQTLTLLGNEITIEDGNTIDLTPILGGGADGNDFITGGNVTGQTLSLTGTGGAGANIDLSSFALDSDVATNTALINGHIALDLDTDSTNELELPDDTGANNGDVLITDGAGVYSWAAVSGGGTDTNNFITGGTLNVESLELTGNGGGAGATVDLSPFALDTDVAANTTLINNHITADQDTDDTNEIELPDDSGATNGDILSTDGAGVYSWVSPATGNDDQNIQGSVLTGETLTIGIENGTAQDVDLSALALDTDVAANTTLINNHITADQDTDDTNEIELPDDSGATNGDILSTDGAGVYSWVSPATGNDDQNIQGSVLTGETLTIGIENGTAQDVDLSALALDTDVAANTTLINNHITADQDTDDTNEIELPDDSGATNGDILSTDGAGVYSWVSPATGNDDQNIQGSVLTGETLTIGIENGTAQDVDLSALALDTDVAANTTLINNHITADQDTDDTNEIELPDDSGATNGDILSTDGAGVYSWVSPATGNDDQNIQGSVLTGETLTIGIENGTAQDVDLSALALDTDVAANTTLINNHITADQDTDDTNEIELPDDSGATNGDILSTDGAGVYSWVSPAAGGNNLFEADDTLGENRTHDLGGFDFVLGGSGNLAIGTPGGTLSNKLTVTGSTRTSGLLNSAGTAAVPSYRFADNGDTGMYLADASGILGFSTNNQVALTINATQDATFSQDVTISQNLDLDGDVLDFNDLTGTVGQVLSSRGAGNGVEWINAAAIAPAIQYSIPFYNAAGNDLQEAIHPTKSTQSFYWDQSARFNTGALFIGVDDGAQNTDAKVQIVEDLPTALAYPLVIQNRTNVDTGGGAVGLLFSAERVGSFGKGALVYERNASFGRGDFHFLQEPNGDGNDPDLSDAALTIKNDGDVGIGTSNPTANLHTAGSFAANIRSDAALNVVIGDNDYTVIVDSATDIDLPAANSAQGRIYIIKNVTGVAITMSADSFVPSTSTTPTSTLQIGVTQLQSDGTNWQQIN